MAHVEGEVWWSEKYDAKAEDAQRNWPVTTDNVIATGEGRAEMRIGSASLVLDRDSEVELARLDDDRVRVRLLQGRIALHLRSRDTAREFEVGTPFGTARMLEAGRYRVDVGRGAERGTLSVLDGHARFDGDGPSLAVRDGETLRLERADGQVTQLGRYRRDAFDDWYVGRERDGERPSLRYVPAEMTGYEDLDDHGYWRDEDRYGAVWVPRAVPSDWAPYRHGRWAWVEPWGWTWIDDMPWGFAPFHYGRWVLIGGLWAWVPGSIIARPVYAPALVVWVGSPLHGPIIGSAPPVGWFPLGPREVFVPAYRCSREHLHRVNPGYAGRIEHADVNRIHYMYRESPRAVTLVPATALGGGKSIYEQVIRIREGSDLRKLSVAPAPRGLPTEARDRRGGSESGERWRERNRPVRVDRDKTVPGSVGGAKPVPGRDDGRVPNIGAPGRPQSIGQKERESRSGGPEFQGGPATREGRPRQAETQIVPPAAGVPERLPRELRRPDDGQPVAGEQRKLEERRRIDERGRIGGGRPISEPPRGGEPARGGPTPRWDDVRRTPQQPKTSVRVEERRGDERPKATGGHQGAPAPRPAPTAPQPPVPPKESSARDGGRQGFRNLGDSAPPQGARRAEPHPASQAQGLAPGGPQEQPRNARPKQGGSN